MLFLPFPEDDLSRNRSDYYTYNTLLKYVFMRCNIFYPWYLRVQEIFSPYWKINLKVRPMENRQRIYIYVYINSCQHITYFQFINARRNKNFGEKTIKYINLQYCKYCKNSWTQDNNVRIVYLGTCSSA